MKQFAAIAVLGFWSWTAHAQCSNNPLSVPLLAHGSIAAGMVTVANDTVNLYVTFATTGDWTMRRADVAVGSSPTDLPQSGGQPSLTQFPYRKSFSPEVVTFTFTIPLASIAPAGTVSPGSSVLVAAHAALDSPTQGHMQAWGAGQLFPCSPACKQGGECDGGGDRAGRIRPGDDGGGGDCHGDHGDHQRGSLMEDGGGGGNQCGGGGDHGDHQGGSLLWDNGGGGGDDGGDQCGGDDHGDHGDHQGGSVQDGGGGGGGDDGHEGDDGGSDCKAGCGATYFGYVVNCIIHE
jgi:hypothetical protein